MLGFITKFRADFEAKLALSAKVRKAAAAGGSVKLGATP
jgi:hypothetical protein